MGSEDVQGELWGAEPEGWASQEVNHSPLFTAMIEAAEIGPGRVVLDIGCGAGHSTGMIHRSGASVIGVDAAQGMVDLASKTHSGVDFRVGALENLDFGDNEFDVVFAANSIQYAADLDFALGELRRVCRPGGHIVAGLFGPPDRVAYRPILESLRPFMPEPPPGARPGGPFALSSPGTLEDAFASAGIEVVSTGEANCPFAYASWDDFWSVARAAGPAQMAIGLAGVEAVEHATRRAVENTIADDGSITFDPNWFIYVVGQA